MVSSRIASLLLAMTLCAGPLSARESLAATQPPAVRCAAAKLKAAALQHAARIHCRQRAILAGQLVDAGCIAAAEAKLESAFARAESNGGCTTTGGAAAIGAVVEGCVDDLAAALPPVPPTTTTTTTSLACSTATGTCGSCGCGLCFGGPAVPPRPVGICIVPVAHGPCGIDPPTPCPAGQLCVVTQFSPFEAYCTEPCP